MPWPRKKVLSNHCGAPYLERYTLLETRWFALKVHHFLRPDEDPELHDHPWSFLSVILRGGYWEETPEESPRRYRRGRVLWRPAPSPHRIDALCGDTWTLVLMGPRVRDWGFWTRDGWVQWQQFFRRKARSTPC